MNEDGKPTVYKVTQAEAEYKLGLFPEGTGEPYRVVGGGGRVRFVL